MTQFDIPWQQPETMPVMTELFDESPFEASAFGVAEAMDIPVAHGGVPGEALVPGSGQAWVVSADPFGASLSSYIAPASSYGEGETFATSQADGVAAGQSEQQLPRLVAPATSASFPPDAVRALPDVLQATPLIQLTATVPTRQVLHLIRGARTNLGTEPGWGERLLVDLRDLPKAAPKTTVHVFVVKTVPFNVNENDKRVAFHEFALRLNPIRLPRFDVLSLADYPLNRKIEEWFSWPPASIATAAGLGTTLTVQDAANYKIAIHSVLPNSVGQVVMPRDERSLRGFEFDKSTLTADHERTIEWLAYEVLHSWHSRSRVTRVVIDGHTDPVGTADYNKALGMRRATAVAERLKQLVNDGAVSLPSGTVDRVEYVLRSFGEERPISRTVQALNRRVEITLFRDATPAPTPLDLQTTVTRLEGLLTTPGLDPDAVTRMRCLLQKVRDRDSDDRFVTETQVFLVNRDNAMPGPSEWSRVRTRVLHPDLFAPAVSDTQVLANLGKIDDDIIYGVGKMTQMIDYAGGADYGLGLLALARAFKDLNKWIIERLNDPKSVYSCYPQLRP